MRLTASQARLLARLIAGPFKPRMSEWITFRSLEQRSLAILIEGIAAATDAGRLWREEKT